MNRDHCIPGAWSGGGRPNGARRALRGVAGSAVAVVAVALLGCGLFEPSEYRVIGLAKLDDPRYDWPLPEIPETATAGVPFEITVTTGGNSCYRGGETGLVVKGRSAVVTPYDYISSNGKRLGCFANLIFFEHTVPVVFEDPGTAEILFRYTTEGSWHRPEDHKGDGRKVYTVEVVEAGN